jgi:hypothetical protein
VSPEKSIVSAPISIIMPKRALLTGGFEDDGGGPPPKLGTDASGLVG